MQEKCIQFHSARHGTAKHATIHVSTISVSAGAKTSVDVEEGTKHRLRCGNAGFDYSHYIKSSGTRCKQNTKIGRSDLVNLEKIATPAVTLVFIGVISTCIL